MSNIDQFDGAANFDIKVSEMSNIQLMWAFYGRSKAFALTLGLLEVTAGLLIFFRKTKLIGCLFATTILANIILQDIFYDVLKGALYAAILYQIIIIVILFLHKDTMIKAFQTFTQHEYRLDLSKKFFLNLFLALLIFVIFRILEYYITIVLL